MKIIIQFTKDNSANGIKDSKNVKSNLEFKGVPLSKDKYKDLLSKISEIEEIIYQD